MIKTKKLNAGSYELTIGSAVWVVNCHARGWWVGYCGSRVLDPMPTLRDVKQYLIQEQ